MLSLFVGKCLGDGSLLTEFVLIHQSQKNTINLRCVFVCVCVCVCVCVSDGLLVGSGSTEMPSPPLSFRSDLCFPDDIWHQAARYTAACASFLKCRRFNTVHSWSARGDNKCKVQSNERTPWLLATGRAVNVRTVCGENDLTARGQCVQVCK